MRLLCNTWPVRRSPRQRPRRPRGPGDGEFPRPHQHMRRGGRLAFTHHGSLPICLVGPSANRASTADGSVGPSWRSRSGKALVASEGVVVAAGQPGRLRTLHEGTSAIATGTTLASGAAVTATAAVPTPRTGRSAGCRASATISARAASLAARSLTAGAAVPRVRSRFGAIRGGIAAVAATTSTASGRTSGSASAAIATGCGACADNGRGPTVAAVPGVAQCCCPRVATVAAMARRRGEVSRDRCIAALPATAGIARRCAAVSTVAATTARHVRRGAVSGTSCASCAAVAEVASIAAGSTGST